MDKTADPHLSSWATPSLRIPNTIAKSDLYSIYTMVTDMKKEMVKSITHKPHPGPDTFKNGSLSAISDSARSTLSRNGSLASSRASSRAGSRSDLDSIGDSQSEGFSSLDCDTYVSPDLVQEFTHHLA